MTVIAGYLNYAGEGKADLMERMLDECTSPYVENTIVKMISAHNKAFGIAMPKNRAILNYLLDDENESIVIIYGYIVKDGKTITATDIYGMNYDELLNLFKNADGSFVVVKYDNKDNKLIIITDWLSTRPLYYSVIDGGGIVFSSCLWSILRFFKENMIPIRLNDKAILGFIWIGRIGVIDDITIVENVRVVPPGSILVYDLETRKLSLQKYYELRYESMITKEKEAIEIVHNALLSSIQEALKALPEDYRSICVFLSGGLDSRVLVYYLSCLLGKRIRAITFGTKKSDEIPIAKKVAKELEIPHIVKTYDLNQLADYVHDLIRYSDGFDVVSATHVAYAMKILIESGCHVFTDGFALDLTLGGSYLDNRLRKITDESKFSSYIFRKISVFNHKELISIIGPRLRPQLLEVLKGLKSLIGQSIGDSYLNKNDYFFLYTRVRRFTVYGSIVERYSSDEILPTISRKFADVFTKIDPNLRMNHKIYRKFLLSLNKRLALIPYKSTWVPPLLPPMLWKTGFVIQRMNDLVKKLTNDRIGLEKTYFDFNEALRQKNWRKLLYGTLLDRKSLIYKLGYLEYDPVKNMVIEHLYRKQNNGEKIAYLLTLELTLREIFKYVKN